LYGPPILGRGLSRYRDALIRGFIQGELRRYVLKAASEASVLPRHARYALGLVDRPYYAYGLRKAAELAKKIRYSGMTAIEFGVGAGGGLRAMEEHASYVSDEAGISIAVFGFDTGAGLPDPVDYRDLPYSWSGGFYPMDEPALRRQLSGAELIIGDVRTTVASFVQEHESELSTSPVGFVAFDLDYWSSTFAAFEIFRRQAELCLPRVTCYFDDIYATIEDVGELLAIRDFNREAHGRRIRAPHGLRDYLPFRPLWADQIFEAHLFAHQRYGNLISSPEAAGVVLEEPQREEREQLRARSAS
jgi:hypothetical protein